MPTPSEPALPPSPPIEASSSRASFASCPPEDDRPYRAPREERIDSPAPRDTEGEHEDEDEQMASVRQEPTPDPEAEAESEVQGDADTQIQVRLPQTHEKGEHVEDTGADETGMLSSSATPDASAGGELDAAAAAQHSTGDPASSRPSTSDEPLYLSFPCDRDRVSNALDFRESGDDQLTLCSTAYTANHLQLSTARQQIQRNPAV